MTTHSEYLELRRESAADLLRKALTTKSAPPKPSTGESVPGLNSPDLLLRALGAVSAPRHGSPSFGAVGTVQERRDDAAEPPEHQDAIDPSQGRSNDVAPGRADPLLQQLKQVVGA